MSNRAAGNDKVPIKAPASGSGNSYNMSKVKCIRSDESYIQEIALEMFLADDRVYEILKDQAIDIGKDFTIGTVTKLIVKNKFTGKELVKKLIPYYNKYSIGKDIVDIYKLYDDLKPIYTENYIEAKKRFEAMK